VANRISPSALPNPVTPLGFDGTDFKALKLDADGALVTTGGGGAPAAHAASHQDGGSDEVTVAALAGVLAEPQDADKIEGKLINIAGLATGDVLRYNAGMQQWLNLTTAKPESHYLTHQNAGADEINVAGLSGELADNQPSTFLKLSDTPATFAAQATKVPYVNAAESALAFDLACNLDSVLKLFRSRRFMLCDFQTVALWTGAVTGSASLIVALHKYLMSTGATSGSTHIRYLTLASCDLSVAEFTFLGYIATAVTSNTIWGIMTSGTAVGNTVDHLGWKIVNGRIWASNGDGAAGTQTDTTIDMATNVQRSLRVVSDSMVPNLKFYVDDVLVATHTTNLPTYTPFRPLFYITNSAASNRIWWLTQVFYCTRQDLL
jgi:hypothetical protein